MPEGSPVASGFLAWGALWSAQTPSLMIARRNAPVAQLDRVAASEAAGRWFESSRARQSMAVLRGGEIIDELDQLRFGAGFGDIGAVLTVHDEEGHTLDDVALGNLLGALQIRADRE